VAWVLTRPENFGETMTRLLLLLFLFAAAIFPGCQEKPIPAPQSPSRPRPNLAKWQAAFQRADKIELYSVEPIYGDTSVRPKIQGFPIIGSTVITNEAEKEKLYHLLEEFIYDVPENPIIEEPCKFSPHHAISITDNTESHKIVICFICSQVLTVSKTLPTHFSSVGLSQEAQTKLDELLKAHGVETAEGHYTRQKGK
jgi:hypothetical protein